MRFSPSLAFEVIKEKMRANGKEQEDKGVIIMATVKGDVHDIGKNIVAVLLENYGYKVIDLGKDVEPEEVVDAALKYHADIVGLSALMTTTVKAMEDTIRMLRKKNVPCKTMVGGAVLVTNSVKARKAVKDGQEQVIEKINELNKRNEKKD